MSSWRYTFPVDNFDGVINSAIADRTRKGLSTTGLRNYLGVKISLETAKELGRIYPELFSYVDLQIDMTTGVDEPLTIKETIERETLRQNQLSFLWLVLHEHGWSVGTVDTYVDPSSSNPADREYLRNRIGRFEVDTQDVYSFLTHDASAYYRCIFTFDTDNKLVNAYKVESIGEDTNIFLSFHNIQNTVTRTGQDVLYTVFRVSNDETLDFTEVNFGYDTIEDLSYFLTTEHFTQDFIDKYNGWLEYRESLRNEYMQLSVEYRN